ncbi:hypothetical protein [Prosthecobacter sp.]|uniref:hypothetical protein n=1 Tax=Prosthecobacter sp. TaxID=1965333 RepID=UPI0025F5639A|nr:hypothetical protein [Prosthecobacter sp.]
MIQMNLLAEAVDPVITKMPAAEFGGGGILGIEGSIYEIRVSQGLAFVLDEQQLILIVEAALDKLPNMMGLDDDDSDDKGEEWKSGGKGR